MGCTFSPSPGPLFDPRYWRALVPVGFAHKSLAASRSRIAAARGRGLRNRAGGGSDSPENFLRFVLLGPIAGSRALGMRLRHMRDPTHGGAKPPLDPDHPAAPKCRTHGLSTIGGSGERSFRCIELGLGVFAGRKRRWLKVSPGRCGKRFQRGT